MNLLDPKTLKRWKDNPKNQTKDQHVRMVERYKEFGQLTAFLVMPDNVILGGNHGLDAVSELGLQAKCIPVDFLQEGEEWFFVNDGEVQRQVSYKSQDEGMIKVSTAHNERFSQYDSDLLANLVGNYNVDLSNFGIDLHKQGTLGEILNTEKTEEEQPKDKKPKNITCPHCKESFEI